MAGFLYKPVPSHFSSSTRVPISYRHLQARIRTGKTSNSRASALDDPPLTPGVKSENLISTQDGCWQIRPMKQNELSAIVKLQTDSFHDAHPIKAVDEFLYKLFYAETLDIMQNKIKSNPGRYQLLVAQRLLSNIHPEKQEPELESNSSVIAGIVEVILMADKAVLNKVSPDASRPEYAYISGICVDKKAQRNGLGKLLMNAAEDTAKSLGQTDLVLRVYEDNPAAVNLFSRSCGLKVLDKDSAMKSWFGGRIRLLLHKPLTL